MDTKKVFEDFAKDLKSAFPDQVLETTNVEQTVKHIEDTFYPSLLQVLQKDTKFFDEPRVLFGTDLSKLWVLPNSPHDSIWKNIQACMIASLLHGNIKDKLGKVVDVAKTILGDRFNDPISKILNDENAGSRIEEFITFASETRLAKLFFTLVEQIKIEEFDLNIEDPRELMALLQNPENPAVKKIIQKVQGLLNEKIRRGEITKEQITSEIEEVKSKIVRLFGNTFNEMLGIGTKDKLQRPVLNTPEARAQYRRDRLRMKLQEKYKNEKNSQ
jgi:hypothetical protein